MIQKLRSRETKRRYRVGKIDRLREKRRHAR